MLFAWLPHLVGALIVLVLGLMVARILASIVLRVLRGVRFDRLLHSGSGGSFVQKIIPSPSKLAGRLTFWAVFLGASSFSRCWVLTR